MEKYIDVAFKDAEKTELQDKSTEELIGEINSLYDQMEFIGKIGISFAANAGQRLIEAKARLNHGEWEDWCRENLKFSIRKANRMMKLAEKTSNEYSFFFKNDSLSDIGISKVWELIAAPEEVVENVIETSDVEEISLEELKEEIKKTKTAYAIVQQEKEESENKISALESYVDELKRNIDGHEEESDEPAENEELQKLNKELEDAKHNLSLLKNTMKDKIKFAKDKLEKEKDGQISEAVKKAREEAEKAAETKLANYEIKQKESEAELEKMKKLLNSSSDENLIKIKVNAENLKTTFNACLDSLDGVRETDTEKAVKLTAFLRAVVNSMQEQLGA